MSMKLSWMSSLAGWTASAMLLGGCATEQPSAAGKFSTEKWLEARWVMEVLTTAEAGSRRLQVARWNQPVIVVAANGGSDKQRQALQRAIDEVNAILNEFPRLTLATNGTALAATAQVQVEFAMQKDWPALGKKWKLPVPLPDGGQDGLQFIRWNERSEINAGVIAIGGGLTDDLLQHTLLEELYQTMGIRNDSGFFPDSIVYESGDDTGGLTQLSERDKKLIRFLYQHVPPGTRPDGLARIIDEHWVYGVK